MIRSLRLGSFATAKGHTIYTIERSALIRGKREPRSCALLEDRARLVFLDDAGCAESSVLRITYPTGEWLSGPVEPRACTCGDGRCKGRLAVTLHESHAGPDWMLTFRG
jgi:hypothetical protein